MFKLYCFSTENKLITDRYSYILFLLLLIIHFDSIVFVIYNCGRAVLIEITFDRNQLYLVTFVPYTPSTHGLGQNSGNKYAGSSEHCMLNIDQHIIDSICCLLAAEPRVI